MPSLTSHLIISLIDKVSGPAKTAAGALNTVAKAEKALAGSSGKGAANLAKSMDQIAQSAERLKKTPFANLDLAKMFDKLKPTSQELRRITADWERFRQSLAGTKASVAFDAMKNWSRQTAQGLREARMEAERLEHVQRRSFRSWRGGARWMLGAAGVYGTAHVANRAGRGAITATAGNQRESARDYLAGLTPVETARLKARSLALSRQFPSVDTQVMHQSLRETATSMRSVDKASELGETLAQGLVVLQSLKGKDEALRESAKFFSALDTLGKNLEPAEVKELYNGYLKALGVEGVDLNLGDLKMIAQQSKSAGPGLSNRFLMSTAPGLQGDIQASKFGTALGSTVAQIIGDRATKKAKAKQAEFGLRDASGWKDQRKIMTDPDKFAWENLIPALQKKGIDPDDVPAVTKAMNEIFSNQRVADLFTKMITQREQYQAKSRQYEAAPGLSAAEGLRGKDPFVALEGVMAQLRNSASQLAEGPLQRAVPMLNSLADAIGNLTDRLSKNPAAAAATGALGVGGAVAGGLGALALARRTYQWFTGSGAAAGAGAAEGAGGAALASRWGVVGRLLGRAALAPNWSGARVMDNPGMMRRLERWRSDRRSATGSFDTGATGSWGPGVDIWTTGAKPIEHLDMSGEAGSAGQKTGEAYKQSITSALAGVDPIIAAAVQRWQGMLSFTANPSINPKFGPAPAATGGQKSGSIENFEAKKHAMFSDYGFRTG